ncbi:hypothetical protein IFM47457_10386, partial [Aspergillus lentulus]
TQFNDANYHPVEHESQFIRIHFWPVPVSLPVVVTTATFNEDIRRTERHLQFNVDAFVSALCCATKRPVNDLACISKLAEGCFNRVL